ncbi:MAG: hypothetical protein KF893_20240 [Caldilineaceae bacterium]|nr:hypothetical protein [Caldilineaceae bacterium]
MVKKYVLCISNTGYPVSLETRKIYEVIPDPDGERFGMLRIIDESGEDYLFEADRFVPIDVPEKAQAVFAVEAV